MDARIIDMKKTETDKNKNIPTIEESKAILNNLMGELNVDEVLSDPNNMGDNGLTALLSVIELPDEEFTLMSGIILDTLEKSLNNSNDRILLMQSLQLTGVSTDELLEVYQQVIDQVDDSLKDKYDEKRRNYIKMIFNTIMNAINDTQGVSKRSIKIPIEICRLGAKLPTYARAGDAGMDVYAVEDCMIDPGETKIIPTGIKVAIPKGYELQVRPKSGRTAKTKLRVANTPGTIDSGYRDEVGIILENIEPKIKDITYEFDENGKPVITSIEHGGSYVIEKGDKIAQLVLSEVPIVGWEKIEDISIIGEDRGGGFGSTGVK